METEERPNIRIEIQNEKMDVDESENEDGEIVEEEWSQVTQIPRTVFTTGINIFDQDEQLKLQERAKRFALKPEEIHSFTDADLEELRETLGITFENESIVRFDTVHLLGTRDMLVEDILDYFAKYAPTEIEFVDEKSCNVKWLDNITAARAMFYTSKAVKGMPIREQVVVKDLLEEEETEAEQGQSILLKNRKVELQVDNSLNHNKNAFKNAVDLTEITIPIPPGYWRLGEKHPKAKCLLLRFALKTDKKPFKTENLVKYYKKLGTTKTLLDKRKEGGIFERNKDLPRGKNPWGNLARDWDQDAKFREATPTSGETVEIKNPSIASRLGAKAASESENEVEVVEERITVKKPKGRSMRMRMYADEEEERLKMKKAIQKIKTQTEKLTKEPNDLRTILSLNNTYSEPIEVIDLIQEDLGSKLKNRSRQMVFSVERSGNDVDNFEKKENIRSDIRALLNRRRARSPHIEEVGRRDHDRINRYRRRSSIKRYESPTRQRSPLNRRRRTPERTVQYRHSRYRGEEDTYNGSKPRSKVAVVVKTPKKPTVASTIWSRVQDSDSEESSSDSDGSSKSDESNSSSSSESSDGSGSESESTSSEEEPRKVRRPGFDDYSSRVPPRRQLKVTMSNDRYSRR